MLNKGEAIVFEYCGKIGVGSVDQSCDPDLPSAAYPHGRGMCLRVAHEVSHQTFIWTRKTPGLCGECGLLFITGDVMRHDDDESIDYICQLCRSKEFHLSPLTRVS